MSTRMRQTLGVVLAGALLASAGASPAEAANWRNLFRWTRGSKPAATSPAPAVTPSRGRPAAPAAPLVAAAPKEEAPPPIPTPPVDRHPHPTTGPEVGRQAEPTTLFSTANMEVKAPASAARNLFSGPLKRTALLSEIAQGGRLVFGYDPHASSLEDPRSKFMIVADKFLGNGHMLGIFTPASGQPSHIRHVEPSDAQDLGRMVRATLFADRSPKARAAHSRREVAFHLMPSQPELHLHGESGSSYSEPEDWDQFVRDKGYHMETQADGFQVWVKRDGGAPEGWNVVAIAEPRYGGMSDLDRVAPHDAPAVDKLIGNMFIAASKASRGGFQVEAARNDRRIVVRVAGGGYGIGDFMFGGGGGLFGGTFFGGRGVRDDFTLGLGMDGPPHPPHPHMGAGRRIIGGGHHHHGGGDTHHRTEMVFMGAGHLTLDQLVDQRFREWEAKQRAAKAEKK